MALKRLAAMIKRVKQPMMVVNQVKDLTEARSRQWPTRSVWDSDFDSPHSCHDSRFRVTNIKIVVKQTIKEPSSAPHISETFDQGGSVTKATHKPVATRLVIRVSTPATLAAIWPG